MSAQSLQIVTIDIPNPQWTAIGEDNTAHEVNSNLSYSNFISSNVQTLSINGVAGSNDIVGLVYVPDLDAHDPCINASAPYVPTNVTRKANLPNADYPLVGIAPWISGNCSLSYMVAARGDYIHALLFYLPGNSTDTPPNINSNVWETPDGGKWKSQNGYPIYAIPSQDGQDLMYQTSLYSGNMTQVPNGSKLTTIYSSTDYVRLFVDIDIGNTTNLPSLWIFLLIVLAILLAIIGLTSLAMHWLQRRRREALRRRVANGEVDLEALGIKRLTVPQEVLSEMPTYTYGTGKNVEPSVTLVEKAGTAIDESAPATTTTRPTPALLRASSYRPTPLSQPTCAICLDDFVAASSESEGTTVRELPCHHIFHPECVDTFLRDSSSLCPMCKKTALPRGYCPKTITNAMVRRERMVRQLRERVPGDVEANERSSHEGGHDLWGHLGNFRSRRISGFTHFRAGRRISIAPNSSQQMQQLGPAVPVASAGAPARPASTSSPEMEIQTTQPQVQPPSTPSRREWARRRAEAMLGPRAPADPEAEEARQTSAWGKAVRSIFPRR